MHTMVMWLGVRAAGFGVKTEVSTALGITDTRLGSTFARRTVFSLLRAHMAYVSGERTAVNWC